MNDRYGGAGDHARHDRVLVSRYGAGDAFPAEVAEAEQLVRRCAQCARLAGDIDALRLATAALPAARRTRDFRLTPADAERLHGSAVERFFRRLATPGLATLRPLAGVAVSIGLVLVVAGVALPAPVDTTFIEAAARQESDMNRPGAQEPLATEGAFGGPVGGGPDGTLEPVTDGFAQVDLDDEYAATETTRSILIYTGLLIAAVSLALLMVLIIARRRGIDPLLR